MHRQGFTISEIYEDYKYLGISYDAIRKIIKSHQHLDCLGIAQKYIHISPKSKSTKRGTLTGSELELIASYIRDNSEATNDSLKEYIRSILTTERERKQGVGSSPAPVTEEFKFSNGFLADVKNNIGIRGRKKYGDAASSAIHDPDVKQQVQDTVIEPLKQYDLENIFNIDETAWYYQNTGTYGKKLQLEGEKCVNSSVKRNESDRFTVVFGCNASGSVKLSPLIIGNAKNPKWLKSVPPGLIYKSAKSGWITREIFLNYLKGEFLQELDNKGINNVALVLDNCNAHKVDLTNEAVLNTRVQLFFLPPNVTSTTQPLDQGIIYSFKNSYHNNLTLFLTQNKTELNSHPTKKKNLIIKSEALRLLDSVWKAVSPKTIQNCWNHSELVSIPNLPLEDHEETFIPINCSESDDYFLGQDVMVFSNEPTVQISSDHTTPLSTQDTAPVLSEEVQFVEPRNEDVRKFLF